MYFLSFSSNESVDILPPPCHFVQKASCSVIGEPNAELISGSVGHAVVLVKGHTQKTLFQEWLQSTREDRLVLDLSLSSTLCFLFSPNQYITVQQLKNTHYPPAVIQPSHVKTHHLFL